MSILSPVSILSQAPDQAAAAPLAATDASADALFIERLVRSLLPHYLSITDNVAAARADIVETLASYGARTRAELINAARIMACSFSALEALAEAAAPDISHTLKLRYRNCANNLNRHCQKDEAALAKRLSLDLPEAVAAAEPVDPRAEEAEAVNIARIRAEVEAARQAVQAVIAQHYHPQAPAPRRGPQPAGPETDDLPQENPPQEQAPEENAPEENLSGEDLPGENPPWVNEAIALFEQSIAEPSAMIRSS